MKKILATLVITLSAPMLWQTVHVATNSGSSQATNTALLTGWAR